MTSATLAPIRPVVPGVLVLAGLAVLFVGAISVSSPVLGMSLAIVGGSLLASGYVLVPPTLLLLVLPHAAVVVFLLLQGLGLCVAACGGFVDYAYVGTLPTAWAGVLLHAAAASAGLLLIRRRMTANLYRLITGFCQGCSLFFIMIMAVHAHWCPSCAASHAVMVAQAIMVWRLTDVTLQRQVWALSVLTGALAVNAVFHHDLPAGSLGPSEQLMGYLNTIRADGQTIGIPVAQQNDTAAAGGDQVAHPGTTSAPNPQARGQRASLVDHGAPLRTHTFTQWGSSDAPVVVRASMSLVCPHCRGMWPDFDKLVTTDKGKSLSIRELVNDRKLAVEFIFTWPLKPETHHAANLATYAVYTAGLLGEDELLAAADRFFSADGFDFMERIQARLLGASSKGTIPPSAITDALAETFQFLDPVVPAVRTLDAFRRGKPLIDATIAANTQWLLAHGDLYTPHFFFTRRGQSGPSFMDVTTLDPEVWGTFATRGLTP